MIEQWFEYLKEAGPFTAPLCMGMSLVIYWLLKDRAEMLVDLKAVREDATALREKRVGDREAAAREYMEQGEATRTAIREWTRRADDVLTAVTARTQ